MNPRLEAARTAPDYYAYIPKSMDKASCKTGNEHFLVEKLPSGNLLAIWTQSSFEGEPDQHIVLSKSLDAGRTWSEPITVAESDPETDTGMASWAFPLVSKTGRIYVIYSRHMGMNDVFTHTTGRMACIYSNDEGASWSEEVLLEMPHSIWDNPERNIPANWIVWQKPIRLKDGRHFTGVTRWVSPAVRPPKPIDQWWAEAAVVEFLRFENVNENPEPNDLKITFLSGNEEALRVGLVGYPDVPCLQEPSVVQLPDERLFCVMRTTLGSPYYSVSEDLGESWTKPLPLRQSDKGPILRHPLSPCPIYPVTDCDYAFFYHNHDGHFLNKTPNDTGDHRRPICLAHGVYKAGAKQPIWFSDPWFLMDNGGVNILRKDLALYASYTEDANGIVLWYPDRKFFLLGKKIDRQMVLGLPVEKSEPKKRSTPALLSAGG